MISAQLRKKFFDLLCCHSSSDLIQYLRAYEGLSIPPKELLEVSCELVNGKKADGTRLAITCLRRQDVLEWFSACRKKEPLIQDILFENAAEDCFGIGLADGPLGADACRIKIYNTYGRSQLLVRKIQHIQKLFPLLNISDAKFKKDLELFRKIEGIAIDWDHQGPATIKVYYGYFDSEQLFVAPFQALSKEEILCYDILRQQGLLPRMFLRCARYSRDGRTFRTDMRFQTKRVVPYLRILDHQREASRFFVDFYKIFPDLELEYISMQWAPVEKMQYYFIVEKG